MIYPPPVEIKAEVFSVLPDHLGRAASSAEWVDVNLQGRPVSSFLEGPSFDRDGNLYVVDIPYGRLLRISPNGEWTVALEYDGWPNGSAIHKDGRIFLADQKHGIMCFDPKSGEVSRFLYHDHLEGFRGCNDLTFASNGDLYFTDQGQSSLQDPTGRVVRYCAATGHVDRLLDYAPSPNGLALNPSENTLYVCVTRANAIWRVPMLPSGRVGKVGVYVQLSGGLGPDGMAVDQEGGFAVAQVGAGAIFVFGPVGQPRFCITSPTKGLYFTNLAYGGKDNRELYFIDSDTATILKAELPVPGLPLYSHA